MSEPTPTTASLVVLDYATLHHRAGSDQLVNELLDLFLQFAPVMFADVQAAVRAGDEKLIRETAHKIKGATCQISAVRLVELLEGMESEPGSVAANLLQEAELAFRELSTVIAARLTP